MAEPQFEVWRVRRADPEDQELKAVFVDYVEACEYAAEFVEGDIFDGHVVSRKAGKFMRGGEPG